MIDIQFLIQQNKFELIWSYILKVMIFTIYRNFSGIFMILIKFILNFYHLKQLNKMQKWGKYLREPTWMQRGAQGHVALPRGQHASANVALM